MVDMDKRFKPGEGSQKPSRVSFPDETYLRDWLMAQGLTRAEADELIVEAHHLLKQRH